MYMKDECLCSSTAYKPWIPHIGVNGSVPLQWGMYAAEGKKCLLANHFMFASIVLGSGPIRFRSLFRYWLLAGPQLPGVSASCVCVAAWSFYSRLNSDLGCARNNWNNRSAVFRGASSKTLPWCVWRSCTSNLLNGKQKRWPRSEVSVIIGRIFVYDKKGCSMFGYFLKTKNNQTTA